MTMKMHNTQRGMGLLAIMFWILFAVFVLHTGFKVFPVYMTDLTIKSMVENLGKESDTTYRGPSDVMQAISRRLQVNSISHIGRDEVTITREGDYFIVDIDYEVVVPYLANISLLMEFSHQTEVRIR